MTNKQSGLSEFGSGVLGLGLLALIAYGVYVFVASGFHTVVDMVNTHKKDTTTYIEGNWWVGEHRTCYGNIAGVTDNSNLACSSPSGRSGDFAWSSFPIHVMPVEYHGSVDRHEEMIAWNCQRKEDSLVCKDITPVTASAQDADASFQQKHAEYVSNVKNRVTGNWYLEEIDPTTPVGATVYIKFHVDSDGRPGYPTIEKSSGYPSLDQSC
jgi:hypothetical protein